MYNVLSIFDFQGSTMSATLISPSTSAATSSFQVGPGLKLLVDRALTGFFPGTHISLILLHLLCVLNLSVVDPTFGLVRDYVHQFLCPLCACFMGSTIFHPRVENVYLDGFAPLHPSIPVYSVLQQCCSSCNFHFQCILTALQQYPIAMSTQEELQRKAFRLLGVQRGVMGVNKNILYLPNSCIIPFVPLCELFPQCIFPRASMRDTPIPTYMVCNVVEQFKRFISLYPYRHSQTSSFQGMDLHATGFQGTVSGSFNVQSQDPVATPGNQSTRPVPFRRIPKFGFPVTSTVTAPTETETTSGEPSQKRPKRNAKPTHKAADNATVEMPPPRKIPKGRGRGRGKGKGRPFRRSPTTVSSLTSCQTETPSDNLIMRLVRNVIASDPSMQQSLSIPVLGEATGSSSSIASSSIPGEQGRILGTVKVEFPSASRGEPDEEPEVLDLSLN